MGYSPGVDEFKDKLAALPIPLSVRVRILDRVELDPEKLRRIATDTVRGPGRNTGAIKGLLPGDRLALPIVRNESVALRLKVGRFADGYRLIGSLMIENGRGGDLPQPSTL